MHPVLAPDAIQVLEQNRRQFLAEAERARLIKNAAPVSGAWRRPAVALRRVRDGLPGAVAASPFRGVRSGRLGDESAAIRAA